MQAGQVYGFLGPNGAGKTTTIRISLDLVRPSRGPVTLFGQPVRENMAVLRRVGAIVEGAAFYPFLSGHRNLEVLARTGGLLNRERIQTLLETVGLSAIYNAFVTVQGFIAFGVWPVLINGIWAIPFMLLGWVFVQIGRTSLSLLPRVQSPCPPVQA